MQLPDIYNYVGILLTLKCNFKCSYCLNWRVNTKERFDTYWLEAIDKIETDLPITLSGGEPSIHGAFFPLLINLNKKFDILTNLSFDLDYFIFLNTLEFIEHSDVLLFDSLKVGLTRIMDS